MTSASFATADAAADASAALAFARLATFDARPRSTTTMGSAPTDTNASDQA